MAFKMKTWVDRLVEFPGRRRLTDIATGEQKVYDVARNEGTVSKEGSPYNAANMNDLEQRIADGFSEINRNIEQSQNVLKPYTLPADYTNCNDLPINSIGYTGAYSGIGNSPGGAFLILTFGINSLKIQIASSAAISDAGLKYRTCYRNEWNSWKTLLP